MSDDRPRRPGRDQPTFRRLVDWVEGRLTRADAAVVERAVAEGGPDLPAAVEWIRAFIRFGRDHPLPQPPPIVRQRLRQAFARKHDRAEPIRREQALIMFDSRDDAVVVGVRGGPSLDDGHRLAFASESLGVLVDILPESATTVRLEGQVLAPADLAPVWEVSVQHPGEDRRTDIRGDGNGSFAIGGVGFDVETMILSNGELEVEVCQPLGRSDP